MKLVVLAIVSFVLSFTGSVSAQPATQWKMSNLIVSCDGPSDISGKMWYEQDFNDSSWQASILPHIISLSQPQDRFYRGKFNLASVPQKLLTWINSDDGIWLYINGIYINHWGADCHLMGCVNNPYCGQNYTQIPLLDITPYLQIGENIISVHVSNCDCQGEMWFDFVLYDEIQNPYYTNDFEGLVGSEWSNTKTDTTPIGDRRFLGQFSNHLVKLNLRNLPEHDTIKISFDLYIIRSWDGCNGLCCGIDIWDFRITNGPTLLHTTFGGGLGVPQSYPSDYPGCVYRAKTRAIESNTLGYNFTDPQGTDFGIVDSVYHLLYTFSHSQNTVEFKFMGSNLSDIPDEAWGLDNVKVEVINENQPPQITHTPITSAIQNQKLTIEFEAHDPDGELESVKVYFRTTGSADFSSIELPINPDISAFALEIPANLITLAGVDYYIEAKDSEGASATTPVYHVNVVDKYPVIIIPGVMGSELRDAETNELFWGDPDKALLQPYDGWMLALSLNSTGTAPDINKRCSAEPSMICTLGIQCPYFLCADGGREIEPGLVLNVIGVYTEYKKLGDFLEGKGYEFGTQLFPVSYDWRLDIQSDPVVDRIRFFIEEATKNIEGGKVNIVAHSQGGMVIRSYIQKYKNDHRIEKVIFLGTPHLGSIKIYKIIKGYDTLVDWTASWVEIDLKTKTFVSRNLPSAYQLLPRNDFLRLNGVLEPINDTYFRSPNPSLAINANGFHTYINGTYPEDIEFYAICGYGLATDYELEKSGRNCVKSRWTLTGDGTVTEESATGFDRTTNFFVQEEHGNLPGNLSVQEKIFAILNDQPNKDISGITTTPQSSGKGISAKVCCPVDLRIIDSSGNILGKNADGNLVGDIPGSDFTIFEDSQAGIVPEGQGYTLEIQARDSGRFTLTLEVVEADGAITQTQEYANIPVGSISKASLIMVPDNPFQLLSLDVNGDGNKDFDMAPNAEVPEELESLFFERGDANRDRTIDLTDAITILSYLFLGNSIECKEISDANSDNTIDISDPVYILSFLFLGTEKAPEGIIYCPNN